MFDDLLRPFAPYIRLSPEHAAGALVGALLLAALRFSSLARNLLAVAGLVCVAYALANGGFDGLVASVDRLHLQLVGRTDLTVGFAAGVGLALAALSGLRGGR